MALWRLLGNRTPTFADPGMTSAWEGEFDRLATGDGADWMELVGRLAAEAESAVTGILGEAGNALAFLRMLAGDRGEGPDEGRIATMTEADASVEIDRLTATGRPAGAQEPASAPVKAEMPAEGGRNRRRQP